MSDPRIEQLYRDHATDVLGWVIRLGGAAMDPEDAAQEVFEIAITGIDGFRAESRPSTWLYGITRRVIANRRRHSWWRRMVGLDGVAEPRTGEDADALNRRRAVQRALEEVSAADREVLVLAGMEERTASEVAEMLGIPVGTVYSRLHTGRRRFATALARQGVHLEFAGVPLQRVRP